MLREEARTREILTKIQGMILPNIDVVQKHIAHAKTLIHDNNFSIADHMIELLTEAQVALNISKVLQDNWYKKMALILKVHLDFLCHFGINI